MVTRLPFTVVTEIRVMVENAFVDTLKAGRLLSVQQMDKNGKIRYNLLKKVIPEAYKQVGYEMIDSCKDVSEYRNDFTCLFHSYRYR